VGLQRNCIGLALKIAKKRGHKRACVAVARKLTVVMHAMWRDGTEFQFKKPTGAGAVNGSQKLLTVAPSRV
jgi:hypothetical protein